MAGFSADWLALREPADHAARSTALTREVADVLARDPAPRFLDLACGTGSNLRYLTAAAADPARPMLRGRWLLVDHDTELLARVPRSADVETRCLDLSTLTDPSMFAGRALVTGSALLDLVSESWLRGLVARCATAGSIALFALSYDGRIDCTPDDPEDATITALVNAHQKTDKGFGPALGPDAAAAAERAFTAAHYRVRRARSDWMLTPASGELQRQLIDGWAQAAAEIAPSRARAISGWRDRRLARVAAGESSIIVGHEDLVAIK